MKDIFQKVLWFLGGLIYLPVLFLLYRLLFGGFGWLGMLPAAYFGSTGVLAITLCQKNRFFMAGLLFCLACVTAWSFFAGGH
ncbi:MAG: hypothetical protein HGA80_09615 [Candidatus Omnitrophica bacterium]|nr:hypothetical protein [Candidatus Omnitrophota bacterium]